MEQSNRALVKALIETQALKVARAGDLFWYTSGTVGPYYINTHYLYGGPESALELLALIDDMKGDVASLSRELVTRVTTMYDADSFYRTVVDALVSAARRHRDRFVWVSGGERRDWFFSVAVALELELPHLYLGKNLSASLWDPTQDDVAVIGDLEGRCTLHVADLVTEASSYTNQWAPALRQRSGDIGMSLNVVDRAQGGMKAIEALGVPAEALLRVDETLFDMLAEGGYVDAIQHERLVAYFRDPHGAMSQFLNERPEFVERALNGDDERIAERARMLVDGDLYGIAI